MHIMITVVVKKTSSVIKRGRPFRAEATVTETTKISESEWAVMNVLWDESPLSSHRVVEALKSGTDWSPKTVKTLLSRLVKKGALGFETEANRYLYYPLIGREEAVQEETSSFMERVFGGDLSAMMLHFVKSAEMSEQEVAYLRKILDQKEKDS